MHMALSFMECPIKSRYQKLLHTYQDTALSSLATGCDASTLAALQEAILLRFVQLLFRLVFDDPVNSLLSANPEGFIPYAHLKCAVTKSTVASKNSSQSSVLLQSCQQRAKVRSENAQNVR